MSVSQVAATLGYIDVAHFSRQHKQYTGRSPRCSPLVGALVDA
jgi:YesN/AraC family two-component response regulator